MELTTGTSDTGTNFLGARILKGKEDVVVQGDIFPGTYEDEKSTRYQYWAFLGEYWIDELGYYEHSIKDECIPEVFE